MLDKLPVELVLEISSHGSGIVSLRSCCRRLREILDHQFWHYVHIEEDQCCYDFGDECFIKENAPFSVRLRNPGKESYHNLAKTKIVTVSIGARESTYDKALEAIKAAYNVEWVGIMVNENEQHFGQLLNSLRPETNKVITQNGPQAFVSYRTEVVGSGTTTTTTTINVPNLKSLSVPYRCLKYWLGEKYTAAIQGLERLVILSTRPELVEYDIFYDPSLRELFEKTSRLRCFEWQDFVAENEGLSSIPSSVRELSLSRDDFLVLPSPIDFEQVAVLTVDDTLGNVYSEKLPNLKQLKVSGDLRFYSDQFLTLLQEFLKQPERTLLERLDLCDAYIYSANSLLHACPARLKTLLLRDYLHKVPLSDTIKSSVKMLVLGSEPAPEILLRTIDECPNLKLILIDGNTRCPRKLIHKIEDRLPNPTRTLFTRLQSPYYFDGYAWHRAVRDQLYRLDIRISR